MKGTYNQRHARHLYQNYKTLLRKIKGDLRERYTMFMDSKTPFC